MSGVQGLHRLYQLFVLSLQTLHVQGEMRKLRALLHVLFLNLDDLFQCQSVPLSS